MKEDILRPGSVRLFLSDLATKGQAELPYIPQRALGETESLMLEFRLLKDTEHIYRFPVIARGVRLFQSDHHVLSIDGRHGHTSTRPLWRHPLPLVSGRITTLDALKDQWFGYIHKSLLHCDVADTYPAWLAKGEYDRRQAEIDSQLRHDIRLTIDALIADTLLQRRARLCPEHVAVWDEVAAGYGVRLPDK